jgi:hypothetical protein
MTHHAGQSGQPAPQARLKVARHGALAECRVNNQAPQSPAGTAESFSQGNNPMPFSKSSLIHDQSSSWHDAAPDYGYRAPLYKLSRPCGTLIPCGTSTRHSANAACRATFRACLRHFVYKMTAESLQRWPPSYAVDQAGSSCLSEPYWG